MAGGCRSPGRLKTVPCARRAWTRTRYALKRPHMLSCGHRAKTMRHRTAGRAALRPWLRQQGPAQISRGGVRRSCTSERDTASVGARRSRDVTSVCRATIGADAASDTLAGAAVHAWRQRVQRGFGDDASFWTAHAICRPVGLYFARTKRGGGKHAGRCVPWFMPSVVSLAKSVPVCFYM